MANQWMQGRQAAYHFPPRRPAVARVQAWDGLCQPYHGSQAWPTCANWGELVGNVPYIRLVPSWPAARRGFGDVGKSAILATKK